MWRGNPVVSCLQLRQNLGPRILVIERQGYYTVLLESSKQASNGETL